MGRGQLVFKGEDIQKKKKKSKHTSKHQNDVNNQQIIYDDYDGNVTSGQSEHVAAISSQEKPQSTPTQLNNTTTNSSSTNIPTTTTLPLIQNGTGRITVSGTVVMGYETRFEREISVGDAILIQNEMRVVTMRLSNISLNISSPFSTNFPRPVVFLYISKPRNVKKEASKQQQDAMKQANEERRHAFDTYGNNSNNEVVYRERTEHGSYRIKTMKVDLEEEDTTNISTSNQQQQQQQKGSSSSSRGLSRSDLLQLRAKKTSDKYC
jgi:hypothetical protein